MMYALADRLRQPLYSYSVGAMTQEEFNGWLAYFEMKNDGS